MSGLMRHDFSWFVGARALWLPAPLKAHAIEPATEQHVDFEAL